MCEQEVTLTKRSSQKIQGKKLIFLFNSVIDLGRCIVLGQTTATAIAIYAPSQVTTFRSCTSIRHSICVRKWRVEKLNDNQIQRKELVKCRKRLFKQRMTKINSSPMEYATKSNAF